MQNKLNFRLALLLAITTWSGLALQLVVFINRSLSHQTGVLYGLFNFCNYFTNLANLIAAVSISLWLRHRQREPEVYYHRNIARALVYVWLAGIIFNLLLRHLMPPLPLLYVTNILLHDVVPVLFLLFWWRCVPRVRYTVKDVASWLIFPTAYFAYIMIRGSLSGRYPYPFFDVTRFGYLFVVENALKMLLGLIVLCTVLVFLNTLKKVSHD